MEMPPIEKKKRRNKRGGSLILPLQGLLRDRTGGRQPLLGRQQAPWRVNILGWGQTTFPCSYPAWHVRVCVSDFYDYVPEKVGV